ncbi:PAS domain S-box protein [Chloroflexales bacterium ZM16-3]|nr:PAS domain S-box protein [Chloroflexales bacterium ZM16-3]
MDLDRGRERFAVRITIIYSLVAATWVVVSDMLLVQEAGDTAATFSLVSITKGLLFVAVTAAILFWLLWRTESKLQLRSSALEAVANAIVISDRNGIIEWVNPAFTTLTGYARDEARSASTRLLRSGLHDEQFYAQLWGTILAGQVWHGTMVNRRKDGTLYDEEQTITPVRSSSGEIIRFIAIKQDISERRQHERALQEANRALAEAYDATIIGWSQALELRDKETHGHSQRVTDLTVRLSRALGIADEEIEHIRRGALLHDIGKMGVPDSILLKPGPLTDAEWEQMRMHPVYAYDLLHQITFLEPALAIPISHHERWDGKGYPAGISGTKIPLAARIFAVVDVWDALTNDRPYRSAWPPSRARTYIAEHAGIHFDPAVVEVFLAQLDMDSETLRDDNAQ